jgi:hypothetical protein
LDEERVWYLYHQLFAEALRHLLQRAHPGLVPYDLPVNLPDKMSPCSRSPHNHFCHIS